MTHLKLLGYQKVQNFMLIPNSLKLAKKNLWRKVTDKNYVNFKFFGENFFVTYIKKTSDQHKTRRF
jgi:hypothetical protein